MDPPIAPGVDDLPLLHGSMMPESDAESTPDVGPDAGVTSPSPPAAGAGSVDVALLLKEIERRVAGIESRFDEVAEGSQRIERQVAAQTEELPVQRAAIARTQRAVRNMSRPDDASPTEPALRDPNAPRSGQQ